MIPVVVAVDHIGEYRIRLTFADGVKGDVDVSQLVEFVGVFAQLRDPSCFRLAHVDEDSGTVAWPGGADLDPLVLYAHVKGVDVTQLVAAEQQIGR